MFNTSTMDTILYLILSLIMLVKLSIVFTASNHGLITNEFIFGSAISFMGPVLFSALLFIILVIVLGVAQLIKQKHRYYIVSILILILSITSIYNVNLLI